MGGAAETDDVIDVYAGGDDGTPPDVHEIPEDLPGPPGDEDVLEVAAESYSPGLDQDAPYAPRADEAHREVPDEVPGAQKRSGLAGRLSPRQRLVAFGALVLVAGAILASQLLSGDAPPEDPYAGTLADEGFMPDPTAVNDWQLTDEGMEAEISGVFEEPGTAPSVTTAAEPAPVQEVASGDLQDASAAQGIYTGFGVPEEPTIPASEIVDLMVEVRGLREDAAAKDRQISELNQSIARLEGAVSTLAAELGQLGAQLQVQHSAPGGTGARIPERPNLTVQTILVARYCEDCVGQAQVIFQDQEIYLADGDSFLGYTVRIQGDRLVLRRGDQQFSYFPEVRG